VFVPLGWVAGFSLGAILLSEELPAAEIRYCIPNMLEVGALDAALLAPNAKEVLIGAALMVGSLDDANVYTKGEGD
jgi:hypothetical protein